MKLESYFASIGSQEEQTQLDIIANNIANSNSPGYKKDTLSFNALLGQVESTDMSQGPIRQTGNNLDIALSGSGLLSVQTGNGTLYTRAGNLAVNSSNQLVTQDGWPVLGKGGAPVTVTNVAALRISKTGQIIDGTNPPNQLALVTFPPNSLKKVQGDFFQPVNSSTQPQPAIGCTVEQQALEGANLNPVQEMAKLIEATRYFETYQRTLKSSNTLDSELIAKTSG
ncbi:MAG: flagellar hook-basal body protein [Syntrophobacteraceae bacterium]